MKSLDCVEIEVSKAKIKMSVVKIQYSGILMNARDTFLEKNNIIKSIIAVNSVNNDNKKGNYEKKVNQYNKIIIKAYIVVNNDKKFFFSKFS